ncbi:MAG: T9SS type A sorting domain-containing protein, partial [Muribaculaceae bacterium]|nr:T9SS type A sorting domain-containing protein [Muribaculaceae bacterium]
IEILKDGVRVPTKTEIMDLEKGFFDRTIYRGTTFTAVAYNENGSTRGTPLYVPFRSSSGVETVEDAGGEIVRVTVYDMSGRVMFDGTPESFATGQLSPGLYVKNEVLKEGVNRTSKIVVR